MQKDFAKQTISVILSILMLLIMVSGIIVSFTRVDKTYADGIIKYLEYDKDAEENFVEKSVDDYILVTNNTTFTQTGVYVVQYDTEIADLIEAPSADITLILCNGATLYLNNGIHVQTLTIYAQAWDKDKDFGALYVGKNSGYEDGYGYITDICVDHYYRQDGGKVYLYTSSNQASIGIKSVYSSLYFNGGDLIVEGRENATDIYNESIETAFISADVDIYINDITFYDRSNIVYKAFDASGTGSNGNIEINNAYIMTSATRQLFTATNKVTIKGGVYYVSTPSDWESLLIDAYDIVLKGGYFSLELYGALYLSEDNEYSAGKTVEIEGADIYLKNAEYFVYLENDSKNISIASGKVTVDSSSASRANFMPIQHVSLVCIYGGALELIPGDNVSNISLFGSALVNVDNNIRIMGKNNLDDEYQVVQTGTSFNQADFPYNYFFAYDVDYRTHTFIWNDDFSAAKIRFFNPYDESLFEEYDATVTKTILSEPTISEIGLIEYRAVYGDYVIKSVVPIPKLQEKIEDNGVSVEEIRGHAFDGDICLIADLKDNVSDANVEKIEAVLEGDEKVIKVYDIKLYRGSEEIQPTDIEDGWTIKISLPIPKGLTNFRILHVHSDGTVDDLDYQVNDGKAVVSVSKLSEFAFVETRKEETKPAKTLNVGALVGIIISGVLLLICIAYVLLFFVFNKYVLLGDKKVRAFVVKKGDSTTKLITFKCSIVDVETNKVLDK